MLAAFLTTVFFSLSALFAQRSVKAVGTTQANIGRLLVGFVVLGVIAHTWGLGMGGAGLNWLLISGVIGMGLADMAFFATLPLLGSRLTVLVTQCLAAPAGAIAEELWLGITPKPWQIVWGLVILSGVAVALMPTKANPPKVHVRGWGFFLALVSALGQGLGAVFSRKATLVAEAAGQSIDGFSAAYQRIAGGLVITLAYFLVKAFLDRKRGLAPEVASQTKEKGWKRYLWIPANAFCGAILGVSCYQWALFTTPSAVVLAIVACTPLVIIPFTYWFEGERPSRRSLVGGFIAVAGAVALSCSR